MWHEYYWGMHWIWWLIWAAFFIMSFVALIVSFNMHDNDDSTIKRTQKRFNKHHHA